MHLYLFPGGNRPRLPRYDTSDLDQFYSVVRLITAPLIPPGEQLNLSLGVHNDTPGLLSIGGNWLAEPTQWRLMQLISFVSGVGGYRYVGRTPLESFFHQPLTAHELIEARLKLAEICGERGLTWDRISKRYDRLLADQNQHAA